MTNKVCRAKSCFLLLVVAATVTVVLVLTINHQYIVGSLHNKISSLMRSNNISEYVGQNRVSSFHNETNMSSLMRNNNSECRSIGRGFLLSLAYTQQTTAGFKVYMLLAKLAGLLNLSSVEPYACKKGLRGGANYNDKSAVKLSNLYNFTHVKNFIEPCCANTVVKPLEIFLRDASRHVVFVSFVASTSDRQFFFLKGRNIVELDCHTKASNINSTIQTLTNWSVSYTYKFFSCSRVVLLDARPKHSLPLRDILNVLGSIVDEQVKKFGSATLVLDTWRGSVDGPFHNFYYNIPGLTRGEKCQCDNIQKFEHSKLVISAAQQFKKHFNLSEPAVGVHIRAEHLLICPKQSIDYSLDCLQQLYNFLQNHSVDNNFPKKIYVFHDLGNYGTTTCESNKHCSNDRSKVLAKFKELRFHVVQYDPNNFKSFPNGRVFASFVEREYLSHVQVLVTVSHGGFQQSIVDRFLKNSSGGNQQLHRICETCPKS